MLIVFQGFKKQNKSSNPKKAALDSSAAHSGKIDTIRPALSLKTLFAISEFSNENEATLDHSKSSPLSFTGESQALSSSAQQLTKYSQQTDQSHQDPTSLAQTSGSNKTYPCRSVKVFAKGITPDTSVVTELSPKDESDGVNQAKHVTTSSHSGSPPNFILKNTEKQFQSLSSESQKKGFVCFVRRRQKGEKNFLSQLGSIKEESESDKNEPASLSFGLQQAPVQNQVYQESSDDEFEWANRLSSSSSDLSDVNNLSLKISERNLFFDFDSSSREKSRSSSQQSTFSSSIDSSYDYASDAPFPSARQPRLICSKQPKNRSVNPFQRCKKYAISSHFVTYRPTPPKSLRRKRWPAVHPQSDDKFLPKYSNYPGVFLRFLICLFCCIFITTTTIFLMIKGLDSTDGASYILFNIFILDLFLLLLLFVPIVGWLVHITYAALEEISLLVHKLRNKYC